MKSITENIIDDSSLKNCDELEKTLIAELNLYSEEACNEKFTYDSDWTYRLKERLAILGTNRKYKICTSGFKDIYHSEWLYDMVWYKESGNGEFARLTE